MGSERSEPEIFGGVSKRSEAAQKIIAFYFSFSDSIQNPEISLAPQIFFVKMYTIIFHHSKKLKSPLSNF